MEAILKAIEAALLAQAKVIDELAAKVEEQTAAMRDLNERLEEAVLQLENERRLDFFNN